MSRKNPVMYQFLRFIGSPLFKWYFNLKIINKNVIFKDGPVIFCGNHRHFMDQFPVIASTSRTIHWMSKKEYFEGRTKYFFKLVGCIKVDRQAHDGVAKKEAIDYLKSKSAVGLFPEGTRNRTEEELLPFKNGAVKMAKEVGCPIIPFAVNGDYKFRSKNLIVRFGQPIIANKNDKIEDSTKKLRDEILKLQRQNYKDSK